MFHHLKQRGSVVLVALLAALVGPLSACGGGSSGAPAEADSETRADGAAALERLTSHLEPPTALPISEPLKATPAAGKTLVWMQCDAPQCAVVAELWEEATSVVGWDLKIINYKTADPATLVDGMKQALQFDPAAVSIVGLPIAAWGSVVPTYEEAGVAIIPMFVGDVDTNETIIANIAGSEDSGASGTLISDWFISDSEGVGEALLFSVPELGPAKAWTAAFEGNVEDNCDKCKVVPLTTTFADVAQGKVSSQIVSKLQQNPSIRYVIAQNVALVNGITAALKSAGISDIKVAGGSAQETEINAAISGEYGAVTPTALNYAVWLSLDAALRNAEDSPIPGDARLNTMVITPESELEPSDSFDYPADWQDQFKQLWQVS